MSGESKRLRRLLMSNALSVFGLVTTAVFVTLAVLEAASFGKITPFNPYTPNFGSANLGPSLAHFFGTDF